MTVRMSLRYLHLRAVQLTVSVPPVIKRPMDLYTILRNVKAHKYKSKAGFAADLDLIWDNCFHYNTVTVRDQALRAISAKIDCRPIHCAPRLDS